MWVRHKPGNDPIILYDYRPTRSGEVPIESLHGFKGYLQCDGYDGYSPVCSYPNVIIVGCMDHCRRKFKNAFKTPNGKGIGKDALIYLKKLYKIEDQIKDFSVNEKYRIRQEKSVPILTEMKTWPDQLRDKIVPKSEAGKAVIYALNEWAYLISYCDDGKLNISNVWIENAIRPFALGRKNYLFSDTVDGANASAMLYSLVETA
jgi:transposase